ncbi:unnamed protein product [Ostreobium quekettii]|uniref:Uncharacterized protein n=1 Tax=Ostreobium quekettii TaxID=121088 RepID=A0A8S1JAM7_9CHLO|nr:unnamed protein product [Ostreobium quekettii]
MSFLRWNVVQSIGLSMKSKCGCDPGHSAVGNPEGFPIEYLPAMASAARWAAIRPGGPMAKRFFARHPTVLQVGSTLFVHGGLLPDHVQYGVNKINKESQMWMLGNSQIRNIPRVLAGKNAVVWTREYSWEEPKDCNCEKLKAVLDAVPGADRMVVGHTIQDAGINSACNGMVYRIDVGMSKGCGDHDVQVLEILEDKEIRRLGWDANGKPKVIGHEDAWTLNTFFGAVRSAVGSAKPA